MLQVLDWPTLRARRKRARLTTFYKVHQGLTCVNSRHRPTVSQRPRRTRRNHPLLYDIPSCRTTYRQMSLFPRTIPEWNLLPAETATAPSLASFQARVAHLK
ncbi:hypothetical protein ACOMHN_042690 [Nucella lapillus]